MNEQLSISILKNLKVAGSHMMRGEILTRMVALEMAHLMPTPTEINQAIAELETRGMIASSRDALQAVRYVLTDEGTGFLLSRGI